MLTLSDRALDFVFSTFYLDNRPKRPYHCLHLQKRPTDATATVSIPEDVYECKVVQRSDLDEPESKLPHTMRIVVISDTHCRHRYLGQLPSADLLIHCGDILMVDRKYSHAASLLKIKDFNEWLGSLKQFKQIYVVAGNHDQIIMEIGRDAACKLFSNAKYIENDSFIEQGIKFFATPLSESEKFGKNRKSKNCAFQSVEYAQQVQSAVETQVASGIDVLISHGRCSSIAEQLCPKLHLWGHSHSQWGVRNEGTGISVCAAMMSEHYELNRIPIVVDISIPLRNKVLKSMDLDAEDMLIHSSSGNASSKPSPIIMRIKGILFGSNTRSQKVYISNSTSTIQ